MVSIAPKGLTAEEDDALKENLRQLNIKRKRALLRDSYYDGKKRLDSFGISIPPELKILENVVGWPAKTCDALSARLHLYGFVMPGSSMVHEDLDTIFAANKMAIEWPQAQVSAFINGAAFAATIPGGEDEPQPLILMMPATEATGLWDVRRRALKSALWLQIEERRPISKAALFLPKYTLQMTREGRNWELERVANPLPRMSVTPLRYRPRMGRPFGMSRINRAVMSLTDQAVRTMLRTEVSAEFYSSPQRYMLGADESMFQDENGNPIPAWQAIIGKMLSMPRDENGELPTVGQFGQQSMEPHATHLRSIAAMFSGETSLPVSSLGIIHDNPASADAMDAAWADFVGVAELCQVELGVAAVEIAQNALLLSDKSTTLESLLKLRPKWRDAKTPTRSAMADAVTKQIAAGVLLPDSEVALEQLGYDQTDISRIQADHARARLNSPLAGIGGLLNAPGNAPVPVGEPADSGAPDSDLAPSVGRSGPDAA